MKKTKNKKTKNKVTKKKISNKYPIHVSLCMNDMMGGLHTDLILDKEDKSFIELRLNEELMAVYELILTDSRFWPTVERLTQTKNSPAKKTLKAKNHATR